MGLVKFAPKKKLNKFLINVYKFEEGWSQISQASELIKEKQPKFCKLWTKKLSDIKVSDHLHTFVVVERESEKWYSFNSSLISFQNHTEIVINNVEIFVISSA